jgi:hypoxanthine phosphoribosyltransferase
MGMMITFTQALSGLKNMLAPSIIKLSESEVESMTMDLVKQLHNLPFSRVVGIANGGLNISLPVARILDKPHEYVRISRYDGQAMRPEPLIYGSLSQPIDNLIIDDLVDGGHTFELFDQHFGLAGNMTAVLFWNTQATFQPNFYVAEKPENWIQFPWGS